MADFNLPFTGLQTQDYLAKARDFSGEPLDDGIYFGSKTYTNYQQYLNNNGALFKLSPTIGVPYSIDTGTYPLAKDDPNLIPYSNFEAPSQEAIDQFAADGDAAIADFNNNADNLVYSVGFKNEGLFSVPNPVSSESGTLTFNDGGVGEEWAVTAPSYPYTPNTTSPYTDTNGGVWRNVTLEARKTVARSLNVKDTEVIYHDDTVTLLDDVVAIYDKSANQKTWKIPPLDSAGKTIVSVIGNVLTTTGGSGSDTYTLLEQGTVKGRFDVSDYGAVPGAGNNSYDAFIRCAADAKLNNGTMYVDGQEYEVTPAVDVTGVDLEISARAVIKNPSGFPFVVEGNGWGYPNQQLTQLPDGISFVKTRHGVVKFTTATTPKSDWKSEDMVSWRMDCYANAELDATVNSGSGAAVMRTYLESGRQEQTSGSGGHLVADWQVYNMSGETPLGTRTEITPLSIGVVMREQDLDADPTGSTNLNQPNPFNIYNELSIHGSSFNVEDYLAGACIAVNKYTSGTFVGGEKKGSDGLSVVTTPTMGAFNGQVSKSRDPSDGTFPLRSGIHIAGFSGPLGVGYPSGGHESNARSAYDVALRVGGLGSGVWNPNPSTQRSKYQDGLDIRDFTRYAINIESQHPDKTDITTPAIRVTAGAGEVIHGDPVRPITDNSTTIGKPSFRYSNIYSVNAANNTSDQRLKTAPSQFPDAVLDAVGDVELISFKWLDAVKREDEGGKVARKHCGIIAQQLKEAFDARGMDAHEWGFFCYDEWGDQYEDVEAVIEPVYKMENGKPVLDDNGEPIIIDHKVIAPEGKKLIKAAGNQYSIRYTELLTAVLAYERRERLKLEAKLNVLLAQ